MGLVWRPCRGVRTFFVISGLLITWLMLREQARTGRIDLTHFYARRALMLLCIPIVLAPFCRAMAKSGMAPGGIDSLFSPYTFATNFDAIALGCAGAILFFYKREGVEQALTPKAALVASAALAAILIPYIMRGFLVGALFTVPFGNTLQALGMATLILQSVLMPSFGLYRILNWSAVAWVGVLSYSLYIWQQLFCSQPQWFGWGEVWWMTWPGWILATFAAAATSYYCLE